MVQPRADERVHHDDAEEQQHDHEAVALSYVDLEYEEEQGAAVGFRLIYPADAGDSSGSGSAAPSSLFSPRWSDAHPVYARGYADVAFFGSSGAASSLKLRALKAAFTALVWLVSAASPVPLLRGRPLAKEEDAADADAANAAATPVGRRLPVVVFSHGASSNRHTYTFLACEIARRVPCAVACIEHCDGSAAVARVPGGGGGGGGGNEGARSISSNHNHNSKNSSNKWLRYQGLGKGEALERKCGVRVDEVRLAVRALRALDQPGAAAGGGAARPRRLGGATGAAASGSDDAVLASFAGRLDLDNRLAIAGHSCGGATAAQAAAIGPGCPDLSAVSAAVALDPWWALLPSAEPPLADGSAASSSSSSSSAPPPTAPLLVVGSHAWQTPSLPNGGMMCGGERQRRVFEAWMRAPSSSPAAAGGSGPAPRPAGALLAVPRGSGHHSFSDVALLLERSRLLRGLRGLVGASHPELPSAEAIEMSGWAVARFLRDRWRRGGGGGGGEDGGAGGTPRPMPRPVSARELDAYRAYFGDRAAILEVKV
jgi:hypothetical protein